MSARRNLSAYFRAALAVALFFGALDLPGGLLRGFVTGFPGSFSGGYVEGNGVPGGFSGVGGSLTPLWAQDEFEAGIDDLFTQYPDGTGGDAPATEPAPDPEAEDTAAPAPSEKPEEQPEASTDDPTAAVDIDELTTSPTKITGSVSAGLGMGAGLSEWPGSDAAGGDSFGDLMRYSGYYYTRAKVQVDARPEPYLRFFSSIETELGEESLQFTNPAIGELFVDYTLADTVFFRVGVQNLTWGQGRLLDNPANLVSRLSEGVAVRTTFPALHGTMNGVIYGTPDWIGNPYRNIDPRVFAYAGQWDTSFGANALTVSGHFKRLDDAEEDIGGALSFSRGIGPFDLAMDMTGHWSWEDPQWEPADWQALGQLLWENIDRSWSLIGEYQFDSSVPAWRGHYAALGLKMPKFGGGDWRPTLRWRHAFQDDSGDVLAGISGTIAPKLTLSVGVPVFYGGPNTYYRQALEESMEDEDDPVFLLPEVNVASFLLAVGLSFSF
jgi:hypothetical protein